MMKEKAFLTVAVAAALVSAVSATTIQKEKVVCGNCGTENTVTVVGSSNQMGYSDLDGRPAEMMRSTLKFQVMECSKCHYCAFDLQEKPQSEAARKIIASPMPGKTLADRFARAAEIQAAEAEAPRPAVQFPEIDDSAYAKRNAYFAAGHLFLRAAWCCDDANDPERAVAFRRAALKNFESVIALAVKSREEIKPEFLIMLCDIYRRAGDFENAKRMADEVLKYKSLPQRMAERQLELCREKKTDRHTLGEVRNGEPSASIVVGEE